MRKPWFEWWFGDEVAAHVGPSTKVRDRHLIPVIDVRTGEPIPRFEAYAACGRFLACHNWMTTDFAEVEKWIRKGTIKKTCEKCLAYSKMTYDEYVASRIAEHGELVVREIMAR